MADRLPLSALSDAELEQRLINLGPRLYPTAPDLATQVRHRLESEPGGRTLTPRPMIWLVAALLLIALVSGLVLFPEARNAIADRLGLRGVLIRWVDEVPSP